MNLMVSFCKGFKIGAFCPKAKHVNNVPQNEAKQNKATQSQTKRQEEQRKQRQGRRELNVGPRTA